MTATPATTHFLEMNRTYPAPRERVFQAWTQAQALARWFAPSAEYAVVVHQLEPHVGGSYRIEMRHSSGKAHIVLGTYREVEPPTRLAFSWRWEADSSQAETLVTISLSDRDGATDLVLRHELFPTLAAVEEHTKGWTGCLDRIAEVL